MVLTTIQAMERAAGHGTGAATLAPILLHRPYRCHADRANPRCFGFSRGRQPRHTAASRGVDQQEVDRGPPAEEPPCRQDDEYYARHQKRLSQDGSRERSLQHPPRQEVPRQAPNRGRFNHRQSAAASPAHHNQPRGNKHQAMERDHPQNYMSRNEPRRASTETRAPRPCSTGDN